jgi:hypothetical protein
VIRAALFVLVVTSCVDDRGPQLDSVTPTAVGRGGTATLSGRRLCGEAGDCEHAGGAIRIGLESPAVHAEVVAYTDREAAIVLPSIMPVGRTALVVTVNERSSNALDFEVLP